MANYIVEVPFRGIETHLVSAKSKADAMRKVASGEEDSLVDWRTTRRFEPSYAERDAPKVPKP